jgi:hypothetical protein
MLQVAIMGQLVQAREAIRASHTSSHTSVQAFQSHELDFIFSQHVYRTYVHH